MSQEQKQRVLEQVHSKPMGAHTGQGNIQKIISENYYWTTIVEDIKDYVSLLQLICV